MTIKIRIHFGNFYCEHGYCRYQLNSPKVCVVRVCQFDKYNGPFSDVYSDTCQASKMKCSVKSSC